MKAEGALLFAGGVGRPSAGGATGASNRWAARTRGGAGGNASLPVDALAFTPSPAWLPGGGAARRPPVLDAKGALRMRASYLRVAVDALRLPALAASGPRSAACA